MDMTLRDFQTALASSSPTPGGGTAAAVALGQAASLTVMVCDLTLGNEKWSEGWTVAEAAQFLAIPLLNRAGELAQADSDAFDGVMDSFKLAKSTDAEKAERRQAIHQATFIAAEIPYETARMALELMKHLPELAKRGNANAVSDVGVAGLLASAAAKGAVFNVEINLASLPDAMGADLRTKLLNLKNEVKVTSREIMQAVRDRLEE
ncbi:MAG: cyclodeaminase/cyclohydrolase family protein [archaeon]|jgi:formiminotetrahydrofolate cyclodeaminase|nr:cyclodeaminase/cyclohydrolase family protein [archaeon]